MVHKCCVASCGMSVRVVGAKGLSYHAFPIKEPNRDKWIQAILPHVDKPEMFRIVQGYTRICSRHFKKKDYSIDSKKRARLSSNAVPSVFPGRDIKDSSLPIRIECIETSSSATISPKEKIPALALVKEQDIHYRLFADIKSVQFGALDSLPAPSDYSSSAIDQPIPLSEDDTASSTFSSQEECYVSLPPPDPSKGNGKVRKRRKHRNASLPPPSNSSKKRSSASEDLNIEGVGDALAEINLSALISASCDLAQGSSVKTGVSLTSLENVLGKNQLLLGPVVKLESKQSRFSKRSLPNDEEESIVASLDSFSLKKDNLEQHGFEQELLMCIQAVNIGPGESTQPPPRTLTPETDSRNPFMAAGDDESLVSSQLHDLYAELVNGGASLSLEDSSAAIFDSQVLIDALQSVTDDLQAGASIDQLARDLSDSFLDGALSPSMLNMGEIQVSDFVPFTTTTTLPSFESKTSILTDFPLAEPDILDNRTDGEDRHPVVRDPGTITKQAEQESPNKRSKEDTDSSPEFDEPFPSPSRSRKKSTRKDKSGGSFSVERFRDSDKDIEYYTGFQTFEAFDQFFRSIDSYVENLKVTDMVHGVASIGLTVTLQESNVGGNTSGEIGVDRVQEEPKRRLSQGRSMSRMDEMFMSIIRLRRKIPEKVIGHMFCISQPSVSRIIRAWTMLLSKILELQTEDKPGTSSTQNSSPLMLSGGQERSKGVKGALQENARLGIPSSFRQLFHSDLAQTIICTGNAALNSRKTSCSTTCPNTSRSKRPKKEKLIVVVSEEFPAATPTAISEEVKTIKSESCAYSIPSDAGESAVGMEDGKIGSVVPLATAAASSGEI